MIDEARSLAKKWLETRKVDAVLGLKSKNGHAAPYLFTEIDELDNLVISSHSGEMISRYFTSNRSQRYKRNILYILENKYPNTKIGVVARGCDEKALIELAKANQLNLDKIEILGVACTEADAINCKCPKPYPLKLDVGKRIESIHNDKKIETLLKMSRRERFLFWKYELSKCIKCYGCRNVCPSCICQDCEMEQDLWVKNGELPPEIPMFHLIRWYHIADRCIECGECEKACPVDIPLLTIFKLLVTDIKEMFNYEAGLDVTQKAPLMTKLDETSVKE